MPNSCHIGSKFWPKWDPGRSGSLPKKIFFSSSEPKAIGELIGWDSSRHLSVRPQHFFGCLYCVICNLTFYFVHIS